VRRVSDDDVSGVVSDMDDDESKAHMKEDEDEDCKHEQKSMQDRKEEGVNVSGYQHQMSIKTCDVEVLILKDKSTTTTDKC